MPMALACDMLGGQYYSPDSVSLGVGIKELSTIASYRMCKRDFPIRGRLVRALAVVPHSSRMLSKCNRGVKVIDIVSR